MGGFFFEFERRRRSAQAKQLDLLQAEVDQEEQLFGDEQLTAEEKQQHELSKKILAMAKDRHRFQKNDDGYRVPDAYEDRPKDQSDLGVPLCRGAFTPST